MKWFRSNKKPELPPLETYEANVSVYRDGDYVVAGKIDDTWIERYKGVTVGHFNVIARGQTKDGLHNIEVTCRVYVIDTIDGQKPSVEDERQIAIAVSEYMGGVGAKLVSERHPEPRAD